MSSNPQSWRLSLSTLLLATVIAVGCDSGDKSGPSAAPTIAPATTGTAANGEFSIRVGSGAVVVEEGGSTISVPVEVVRSDDHNRTVTLAAEGRTGADVSQLRWQFLDASISADESTTSLNVQLDLSAHPILAENRILRIIAADANLSPVVAELTLIVQPTTRPDVYLLAGQSNMLGFSEPDAKQVGPGQPDEPFARIRQLNVTGNDQENFGDESRFTDPSAQAAPDPRYIDAVDPLHDGFDTRILGKEAGFIGPGLSFAKRALEDTTAEIFLVPTAWSDTGFCSRGTNVFPTIGWLTSNSDDESFSGRLLHDRAILRTNIVLEETGGILRGILWHQGEADSDDPACAAAYEQNLRDMVASLRSNIAVDERGQEARGPDSDVPFVVATMSKGEDERGEQLPFNDFKIIVDGVHRNIANVIPNADFVNNDDLVPPAYPCGEGSCIHFGAAAYREMGSRYYDRLRSLVR